MGLGSRFEALDYVNFDSLLDEEERMIRDTIREFVTAEVIPIIEHHFREGTFPNPLIPKLGELGVLGANLEGYGCAGLGPVAYGLIMQELERGDSGLRSFASVQGGSSCTRSEPTGRRSSGGNGSRDSPPGSGSVASASPSPTTARTPAG